MSLPEHLRRLGIDSLPEPDAGAGITVGVLDGGVAPIAALRDRLESVDPFGVIDRGEPTEHATRCASLIAARHAQASGIVPGARVLSVNVSREGIPDPDHVAAALTMLAARGVPVASCSFVLEHLTPQLRAAIDDYLRRGYLLVGAAGNARRRRQFEFVRRVPGAFRVFADAIDSTEDALADEVCAPGRGLCVVGLGDAVDLAWPGLSSAATALMAGLAVRLLAQGLSGAEVRARLQAVAIAGA